MNLTQKVCAKKYKDPRYHCRNHPNTTERISMLHFPFRTSSFLSPFRSILADSSHHDTKSLSIDGVLSVQSHTGLTIAPNTRPITFRRSRNPVTWIQRSALISSSSHTRTVWTPSTQISHSSARTSPSIAAILPTAPSWKGFKTPFNTRRHQCTPQAGHCGKLPFPHEYLCI